MKNLETMNIKEAVEHCYDRRDYPEVICDDAGLDISIPASDSPKFHIEGWYKYPYFSL